MELREAKARVDLPFYRGVLDEFSFSLDLLLHAIESQLRESGMLPINSFQILRIVYYTVQLNATTVQRFAAVLKLRLI